MRLERLKYFLTVAETGSFSAAAEQLYTTQSAVSKHVIALEKELGFTLFDRTHRKVALTKQGQIIYDYAQDIVDRCDEMFAALQAYERNAEGELTIASIPVMGQYGITELVGYFRANYPNVAMSVGELEGSEILNALEHGKYDMAFMRTEQLSAYEYECLPLKRDVLTALLPENHPLADAKEISLSQLKDEAFLLLNEGTLLHRLCVDACLAGGFSPRVTYTGTRNENIARLVAMGMGVSLVMEQFYQYHQPAGVRCVPLKEQVESTIALVRLKTHAMNDAANAFWNYVRSSSVE